VALSLALAKRPRLLLLDEPVAALDPLARRDFIELLLDAVHEDDLTVIMSSHLVSDLECICDYMVLLAASQVQLCGTVASVLDADLAREIREKAAWDEGRPTRTKSARKSRPSTLEEVVLRHMEAAISTRQPVQHSLRGER
jgi:ABC-2 type transport system ATP-binding protein